MPSNFTEMFSVTAKESLQTTIQQQLTQSRARTLSLLEGVNEEVFRLQANPDFSPVGWHLGHIGFTESLWLLEQEAGSLPLFPEYRRLFAADGLPKSERQNLPSFAEICEYLNQVREKVWDYLQIAPLESRAWLWYWLVQHESQHCETIAWVLQLHRQQSCQQATVPMFSGISDWPLLSQAERIPIPEVSPPTQGMIHIEGGPFLCGHEGLEALDNEKQGHWVDVDPFWMDRFPVTQSQYQRFMEAGGYRQPQYWSAEGWQWLQANPVNHPSHWSAKDGDDHPVCGVSWYEADAYARFVDKRLPTEVEWEKAACWSPKETDTTPTKRYYPWGNHPLRAHHCNHGGINWGTTPVDQYSQGQSAYGCYDLLGNVWEWTDTWFHAFPGFEPYPYKGYSMTYFDHQHRVLKGGSWATHSPVLRGAFRNWYEPRIRIHFAGFRCAYS